MTFITRKKVTTVYGRERTPVEYVTPLAGENTLELELELAGIGLEFAELLWNRGGKLPLQLATLSGNRKFVSSMFSSKNAYFWKTMIFYKV